MHHDPNIAPQHVFDNINVNVTDHAFSTTGLPPLMNHPSPGSIGSLNNQQLDLPMTYEQLLAQNTLLKTRVSELEVINMVYSDNENNLRRERDDAMQTQDNLKRRVEELETQLQGAPDLDHPSKRTRRESPIDIGQLVATEL